MNNHSRLDKLENTRIAISGQFDELRIRLEKMKQESTRIDDATVMAGTAVFPKVRVCFGTQCLNVKDKMGPSVFKLSQGEVVRLSKQETERRADSVGPEDSGSG